MSGSGVKRRVKWSLIFQDAVSNVEQFPHGHSNDHHLILSPLSEPVAEDLDGGVASKGRNCGKVQYSSQPITSNF